MKKTRKEKIKEKTTVLSVVTHRSTPATTVSLAIFIAIAVLMSTLAYDRNRIYYNFISLWGNIAKTSPNKRRAHENYGQALSTVGRLDEALREFNTVMALPDDGSVPLRDLYREIGVVYFRMNRMEDAISSWRTGLKYAPYDPSLLNNLSIALMQTGRFDEAAAHAETALSADPNMPQALNTMGQVLLTKGDYERAIKYFARSAELQPDVPSRYWNLAMAYERAGKIDLAIQNATYYASVETDGAARARAAAFLEHLKRQKRR